MKYLVLAIALLLPTVCYASQDENQSQAGFGAEITIWENPTHKLQPSVVFDYEKDIKNDSFNFMTKVKLNVFNWLQENHD